MAKITFMGAGSTIFVRHVIGDCMCVESLRDAHVALYDISADRLKESEFILKTMNEKFNEGRLKITTHLGVRNRKAALRNADFVINAIQVGGYEPSTVIDFEIPKKYGLRQTIADTLGIATSFSKRSISHACADSTAADTAAKANSFFIKISPCFPDRILFPSLGTIISHLIQKEKNHLYYQKQKEKPRFSFSILNSGGD